MKYLIHQVNQLNKSSQRHMPTEKFWTNHFKSPQVDPFQQFNIQPAQHINTPVWPNVLQPTNLKSVSGLPHFSSKY